MESFFQVILLVAASVLVFGFYYIAKNIYIKLKVSRIHSKIRIKRYLDEKSYLIHYLRSKIQELQNGQIQWILVSSRLFPEEKIEIVFSEVDKCLRMQDRIEQIDRQKLNDLHDLGMSGFSQQNELYSLQLPPNAKIAGDIIYYLFERVHGQQHMRNIKIKTSGGP